MYEAVPQGGGAGTETPLPSPGWKEAEQQVEVVGLVSRNDLDFPGEAGGVDVGAGGERGTKDPPGCLHYRLLGLPSILSASRATHYAYCQLEV